MAAPAHAPSATVPHARIATANQFGMVSKYEASLGKSSDVEDDFGAVENHDTTYDEFEDYSEDSSDFDDDDRAAASAQSSPMTHDEHLSMQAFAAATSAEAQGAKERANGSTCRILELIVQSLNGSTIAVLECSPCDTIYEVKQRLSRLSGHGVGQQQLVLGETPLQDSDRLSSHFASAVEAPPRGSSAGAAASNGQGVREQPGRRRTLTVSCVRVGFSSLASLLEEEGLRAEADLRAGAPAAPAGQQRRRRPESLHAALVDVADSVMQHEHVQSVRHMPCVEDVSKAVSKQLRAKLITWMVEAFDVLEFNPDLLYGTVLTLDRYCAAFGYPLEHATLGVAVLAAICTEMKLSSAEFPSGHWQRLLHHLCQGRFGLPAILQMEHEVLVKLNFVVGVPTSLTFYTGLSFRIQSANQADSARWIELGMLLLNLALLDPELLYKQPHAVLGAAALSGALSVCGAPADRRAELLEDLAAYVPGSRYGEEAVLACEEDLLQLWSRCASGQSEFAEFVAPFERVQALRTLSPTKRLKELEALRVAKTPTVA